MTKPRGIHANFVTECWKCRGDITVSNGKPERHDCRERIDLDAIRWPEPNRTERNSHSYAR